MPEGRADSFALDLLVQDGVQSDGNRARPASGEISNR